MTARPPALRVRDLVVGVSPRRWPWQRGGAPADGAAGGDELPPAGPVPVRGVDLVAAHGESIAIVGESGAGKTLTGMAILSLLPPPLARLRGTIEVDGRELTPALSRRTLASHVTLVPQDPLTALNPVRTIGSLFHEVVTRHHGTRGREARRDLIRRILGDLGLPDPDAVLASYPHQLSGGMRQRVLIGMALAIRAPVLVADEPTTALDVTIQRQILELLREQVAAGRTLVLITHDLGVVAELCQRVYVMYGGRVVEEGPTAQVVAAPRHPYTRGLLGALPRLSDDGRSAPVGIPGRPPAVTSRDPGCAFAPRCDRAVDACRRRPPPTGEVHRVACWRPLS